VHHLDDQWPFKSGGATWDTDLGTGSNVGMASQELKEDLWLSAAHDTRIGLGKLRPGLDFCQRPTDFATAKSTCGAEVSHPTHPSELSTSASRVGRAQLKSAKAGLDPRSWVDAQASSQSAPRIHSTSRGLWTTRMPETWVNSAPELDLPTLRSFPRDPAELLLALATASAGQPRTLSDVSRPTVIK
jgi:hypothetical protein